MKFESYKTKIDIGDIIYVIVRAIMVALLGTMLTMMAFEKMIQARNSAGLTTVWETPEDVMNWWLGIKEEHNG